ncbi:MAG: hypothetical protein G01um101417_644 [Parcubacteria group bacterium Gr01-1014_17]|nr:MAG: hypothetical protein G01um101417_644 [Parcubacteria group bacterium Gr01-1014_17]
MIMKTCPVCDGDGECRDDFHPKGFIDAIAGVVSDLLSITCPACGGEKEHPGKCSTCGGTGEVDD